MKVRLIIMGLLAACVLGTIGSASASAANEYFVEGKAVKVEAITDTSVNTSLEAKIVGGKATITGLVECQKSKSTGEFEEKGAGKGSITLEECKLFETAGVAHEKKELAMCKVPNFKYEYTSLLETGSGISGSVTTFKAVKGEETLAAVVIEGAECQVPGTFKLKGTQKCTNDESLFGVETHWVICSGVGNTLKLGATEPAIFTMIDEVTVAKKKWFAE